MPSYRPTLAALLSSISIVLGAAAWFLMAADVARAHLADPPFVAAALSGSGFILGCVCLVLSYQTGEFGRDRLLSIVGVVTSVSLPVAIPFIGIVQIMFSSGP